MRHDPEFQFLNISAQGSDNTSAVFVGTIVRNEDWTFIRKVIVPFAHRSYEHMNLPHKRELIEVHLFNHAKMLSLGGWFEANAYHTN